MHAEFKYKSDTSNNMGNWNYFKITDKIHEHIWKSLGTKENSYTGHCALTSKCNNVRVQKVYHGK
jgi:hypothetical protein